MELLHSGVHRGFRRDLDRADLLSGDFTPTILTVLCPGCGAEYFANPLRPAPVPTAPAVRKAVRARVRVRLGQECPDHGHRMEIEPGPE